MMRRARLLLLALALAPGLAMADPALDDIVSDEGLNGFVKVDRLPVPSQPFLAHGREVWAGTCQNCHGGNKATGAPKITSAGDWTPRMDQGLETLFAHAIDGFMGPKFTQMPARGGNSDLSDQSVRAAVTFMIWASGGAQTAEAFAQTQ